MDFVNFEVGSKTISLAILNILLTEQYRNNLTEVPNNNPNFLGAKEFMNVPVPIFDLGRILNNRSTKEFNLKTVEQLQFHKQSLNNWFDSTSNQSSSYEPVVFKKWLESFKSQDSDLSIALTKIAESIELLLAKASKRGAVQSDENIEISKVLTKINQLFDSAIEHIEYTYKPIIIFTTIDDRNPHVGLLVDKVKDNIHVKESDIKGLDSVTSVGFDLDNDTKAMLKGLIQLDGKHSLIIDPAALFKLPDSGSIKLSDLSETA